MVNEKTIDGVKYISTKRAAEITAYAPDYMGQLCRAEKIPCIRVGRSWFVSEDAILNYTKPVGEEEKSAKKATRKARTPKTKKTKSTNITILEDLPALVTPETPMVVASSAAAIFESVPESAPAIEVEPLKELQEEIAKAEEMSKSADAPTPEVFVEPEPIIIKAPALEAKPEHVHVLTPTLAEVKEIEKAAPKHDLNSSKFTKIHIGHIPQKYALHFPEASIIDKLRVYGSHSVAFLLLMIAFAFSFITVAHSDFNFITDSGDLFSYNNVLDATDANVQAVADFKTAAFDAGSQSLAAVIEVVNPNKDFSGPPSQEVMDYYLPVRPQGSVLDQAVRNIERTYGEEI